MDSKNKLLIDTNILIDVLYKREPFFQSSKHVLELCYRGEIKGMISVKSVCDIFYFIHKLTHDSKKAYEAIENITRILLYAPLLAVDILKAYELRWNDFEDCLLFLSAKGLKADGIVTRNAKHFNKADIQIYSPEFFAKM